jgi:glycosyltransferase involved in cell wall biosynthesis
MRKPVILTFVAYYLPGYKSGGPVRTISNMVERLGDELDFRIVTLDRDKYDSSSFEGVQINSWNNVGKASVFYMNPMSCSLKGITDLIKKTPHDMMYLNSFFNPCFTIKPLLARRLGWLPKCPVIVAPRGEFSEGALTIKGFKKESYMRIVKICGIYKDVIWQASSEHEVDDIKRALGRTAGCIRVAPNIASCWLGNDRSITSCSLNTEEPLRMVFLSRVSPKKNLDFALKVLKNIKTAVKLNIYGVIDDPAHWQRCQSIISDLPSNISVKYCGPVEHDKVADVFSEHDIFFLPTRGENYGHAIIESLAAGVPVLISDQTPWKGLNEAGVGWALPLDNKNAFVDTIEKFAHTDLASRIDQRDRARKYSRFFSEDAGVEKQNLELFLRALDSGNTRGLEV